MKILRKPHIAASIAITLDMIMLVVSMVLSSLRNRFPTEYGFDNENKLITSSHPYDMFGIIAAAALVIAAVMTAFIIAGAFNSTKTASRIVGGIMLMIFSAAAILISWFIVKGPQPIDSKYFPYTDETHSIIIVEEKYRGNYGTAKIYAVDIDSGEAKLAASTDISTFAADDEDRYKLKWVTETMLHISFVDGINTKELTFVPF